MLVFFMNLGAIFAFLAFIHFFVDFIFQTDWEARNKAKLRPVRFWHCVVYTIPFLFFIFFLSSYSLFVTALCAGILLISHYIIDSYIPVFLWAKHVRRIQRLKVSDLSLPKGKRKEAEKNAFIDLFKNSPIHTIIFIAVDQIFHLFFVMVVAVILML